MNFIRHICRDCCYFKLPERPSLYDNGKVRFGDCEFPIERIDFPESYRITHEVCSQESGKNCKCWTPI